MGEKVLYYLMPILKVFLFIILVYFCFLPTAICSQFNFFQEIKDPFILEFIAEAGLCLAVFGGLLMVFKLLKQYDFETIFIDKENIVSGFLKGTAIGFVLILACTGLLMATKHVVFNPGKINVAFFIGYLLFYFLVAIFEEFFFRTFALLVFAERYPITLAIFLSSALFGLAHMGNDGFTWLAMVNITLAGGLFSILILQKRNISWAIGLHFGWNFTQGTILGYQVSGINSPGFLMAKPLGPNYLSGGSFGIEGTVFCTSILIIMITYLIFNHKIAPVQEVLLIQEFEEE